MDTYNSFISLFTLMGFDSNLIPNLSLFATGAIYAVFILIFGFSLIWFCSSIPSFFRKTFFIRTENGYHLRYGYLFKCGAFSYAKRYNKKHLDNNILYIVAVADNNYLNTLCMLPEHLFIDDLNCLYCDLRLCSKYNVHINNKKKDSK